MLDFNSRSLAATLLPFAGSFGATAILRRSDPMYLNEKWSKKLKKPWFCPPPLAFPVVWSGLFGSMGYASYLVYRDGGGFAVGAPARAALALYGAKLALAWSFMPVLVGLKRLGLSLGMISALWAMVAATGREFYQINPTAGLLFVPYLGWTTLATLISYRTWRDNPDADKIET